MTTMPQHDFGSETRETVRQGQDTMAHAAEQAKQQAKELADQAQTQAKSALTTRKHDAVSSLDSIAQAFHETGHQLEDQDEGMVAQYTHRIAEQIEQFSRYLNERDVDQLLGDVESFARRRPEVFLGGAFTLGLLAARFLKSSSNRYQTDSGMRYGTEGFHSTRDYPATTEYPIRTTTTRLSGTTPGYDPEQRPTTGRS